MTTERKYIHAEGATEIQIDSNIECPEIHVGNGQQLKIIKMFGPSIFLDIRVTSAGDHWLIEREFPKSGWVEWCRIPAQLEEDFTENQ